MIRTAVKETLTIPGRFNGPPTSANGGYACGAVAELVEGVAEVTLRSPPPLETPMLIERDEHGSLTVLHGETLVATARQITYDPPDVPATPTPEEAAAATEQYLGLERHEFAKCFSCGPDRDDGLGIFPGPTAPDSVAAPWTPDASLPHAEGIVTAPVVWASLDCPGAWATVRGLTEGQVVLGRMAAIVSTPVEIGRQYLVTAWTLSTEGRKTFAATALTDDAGVAVATARQTWITLT